jgi:serine/threonine protein kinase
MGETYRADTPSRILPVARALDYIRQILEGLACLHHEEIIHRDIKPFNILVTDRDTVKICDFGLSKLRGEKFAGPPNLKVGSPWYAAPEQEADPDAVDFRADLYPLGVMLYRMLTGRLPLKDFEPPSRLNTDLDAAWDRFIAKSLAFHPADRFAGVEQMQSALDRVAQKWKERREAICELPQASPEKPSTGIGGLSRRRQSALKIGPRQARKAFGLDRLWRPTACPANRFHKASDATLTDLATGLTWQTAGSAYPLTWQRAHQYVQRLNEAEFEGSGDWRLPTVDELISLLKQVPRGRDHCLEAAFNPLQNRLWSCDRKSFGAAWYVDADLGFVHWQDYGCRNYAKAVRGVLP